MAAAASTASEARAPGGAHFGPAEVEPKTDEGGGLEAPATRPSWLRRTRVALRNSVWTEVLVKLLGVALAMIALSGVGTLSILSGVKGARVPLANLLGSDLNANWLSGQPMVARDTGPGAVTRGAAAAHGVPLGLVQASVASLSAAAALTPALASTAQAAASAGNGPADGRTEIQVAGTGSAGMTPDGKVILNLASGDDLRHLPGVGQKRADAILALRSRLGRFKQLSDLLRVKGIGVRGLKKILPHVVLDAPKTAA